jgi:Tat protein translocase TatB subunit
MEEIMFNVGMPELMVIIVIALLVVGPKKLPDLAKSLGKGFNEFRKATNGVTESLKETLREDDIKKEGEELKNSLLYGKAEEKEDQDQASSTPAENKKTENSSNGHDSKKPS